MASQTSIRRSSRIASLSPLPQPTELTSTAAAKKAPADARPAQKRKRGPPAEATEPSVAPIECNEVDADTTAEGELIAHKRVIETLRIFNTHYLSFVQEEEKRRKEVEDKLKESKARRNENAQNGNRSTTEIKRASRRPDLKAITQAYAAYHGFILLMTEEYKCYSFPIATSIVLSGQYEDDMDNMDDVIYTGQGGNNLLGDKKQFKDQALLRGNLGLKNSMMHGTTVRVIRGHKSDNSYCGKVYTYDGLYKVVKYWAEKGEQGFTVYKFRLKRLEGQPPLTSNQVINTSTKLSWQAIYNSRQTVEVVIAKGSALIPKLVKAKAVVFECGPNCGCKSTCVNRTSQNGIRYRLEVFRTQSKGWAVRSWDAIPSGAPICEYIGLIKRTEEVNSLLENNFIFDIDCIQTMKGLEGRESRDPVDGLNHIHGTLDTQEESCSPEFCIDAGLEGNVARFINHSCEPNLFVQCVLSSHRDPRFARIVLFASDNIPALQELTYDYAYRLDSVVGENGQIKKMECHCGAVGCRKRLY
ncbi:Histone-lysine N-methyltransferase, H3 lysine-9 specific SUVH4 [Acorus gramineus]|uniref:Histone-lysine N-methyltransferase, H3 lysine-9 specific SUVH4 n=1 Tax=Acorus gramineus TaxID=55184 RepID=A0AAV9BU05_ACOGR|nr:Histone-lysine N-methyltransferase, H3 lysine-9 specific SUVH4 [Acorus gramineus]